MRRLAIPDVSSLLHLILSFPGRRNRIVRDRRLHGGLLVVQPARRCFASNASGSADGGGLLREAAVPAELPPAV